MSFLGKVRAECPKGCEPWDAEIWSFINASADSALRESLLGGDLNLLSCPECGTLFYPDATVVYLDSGAELLAFVFPESYRSEEARWRAKMEEDFAQMKDTLPGKGAVRSQPALYFGMSALRETLEQDDMIGDEVDIAAVLIRDLKLSPYFVSRKWAREKGLPWLLPFRGSPSPISLTEGIKALLKANDKLESYARWLQTLQKDPSLPPGKAKA